jgi:hypothetical protein
MAKIQWLASEYRDLITIIGIVIVLIVNIATASYVYGKVSVTIDNVQIAQRDQMAANKAFTENLDKLTNNVMRLTERMDDYDKEHIQLMTLHGLLPFKWQRVKADGKMKQFPQ